MKLSEYVVRMYVSAFVRTQYVHVYELRLCMYVLKLCMYVRTYVRMYICMYLPH